MGTHEVGGALAAAARWASRVKGDGAGRRGDNGWVGEIGEGTVSAKLGRLLLPSGMTRHLCRRQHAVRLGLELVRCNALARGRIEAGEDDP